VHTGSRRQGVTFFQRLAIVIRLRHGHARPHRVTAPEKGAEVGAVCDP
jgi:hypothetical protein